jgi:hypothetical protein
MDIKQSLTITTNNAFQNLGSNGYTRLNDQGNLPVETRSVEDLNKAIGAVQPEQRTERNAIFGTHFREAVSIVRDWARNR